MYHHDIDEYYFNKEMIQYFYNQDLYSLQFEINTDCGQNCKYCYIHNSTYNEIHLEEEFVFAILEQLAEMRVKVIEWLGGDPIRHPSFSKFLRKCNELGIRSNIWSSGDLLDSDLVVEFLTDSSEGLVSFHIDTLDPIVYRQLAASPKYIDKVLENVKYLFEIGISSERLFNCMTFTKYQAGKDFENTVRTLYNEYGIFTGIVPYKPVGNPHNYQQYVPTTKQIYEAYKFLSNIQYNSKMPVIPNCVSKYYCGTTSALTINRELTLCTRIRQPVIKITGTDLKTAFESVKSTLLRVPLRASENLSKSCILCGNSNICWGCRGNAFYYAGDYFGPDVKCWNFNKDTP